MKYILIGFMVCLFVLGAGCVSNHELSKEQSTEHIVSLDFKSEVSGSFSLGSGSIDEEQYFYYYRQESDGALTLQKSPTWRSRLYMDSTPDTARIELTHWKGGYLTCGNDETIEHCKRWADMNGWIIYNYHVPPGTVTKQFNANVRG